MHPPKFLKKTFPPYFFHGAFAPSFIWSRRPWRPLTVPNVTAHTSPVSLPITVLLYNGPLLCGFNVPLKGLTDSLV